MLNKIYAEMEKAAAASKAKSARMEFEESASRTDAILKSIVANNDNQVSQNGVAGALQVFANLYSPASAKRRAATQLLNTRRTIRYHRIYNGKDVSKADWAFKALEFAACQRRKAMVGV